MDQYAPLPQLKVAGRLRPMGAGFRMNLMMYKTTVHRHIHMASQGVGLRCEGLVKRQDAELSSSACCIN